MSHQSKRFKEGQPNADAGYTHQATVATSESSVAYASTGSIHEAYDLSEAASKSRLAAQNSALYHSASLPCPLRSFVSFGRSTSFGRNSLGAGPPPGATTASADSGSVSGKLPTFSPIFSSFGCHTSLDSGRSQPVSIPHRSDGYAGYAPRSSMSGVAVTAPLTGIDSEMSAGLTDSDAAFGAVMERPQGPFGDEDLEVSYRDWHNGVFSPSW